jgi:hypothetical protein
MFKDTTKRMTAAEYAAFAGREPARAPEPSKPSSPPSSTGLYALGRLKTGEMNKGEAEYAAHLEGMRAAGAVLWWKFEGVKLRLADNTFYTCDFAVLAKDGILEMHEYKGFWQDDARVKIKVAASLYPFRFVAVKPRAKKQGGGYEAEAF